MGRWLAGLALVGLVLLWWCLRNGGERGGATAASRSEDATSAPPDRLETPVASETATGRAAARGRAEEDPLAEVGNGSPLRSLVIEVVDPSGAPRAGIPLRLDPGQAAPPQGNVPGAQPTDARGRVVFEGMRETLAQRSEPWMLRADLAFEEPPSLVLNAAALAPRIVRFELPPGGPLDVSVHELDGAPAPKGSALRLRLVKPEELHELDLTGPEWKNVLVDGATHFPWVELARNWELSAWRPRGPEPTRLSARGPERLGERVALELVLGSDHPVVSYRVLTPEQRPLASAELELTRSRDSVVITTDQDGRFTLDAGGTLPGSKPSPFVVAYRPPGGATLLGRASLPVGPADGWNDGGDILLVPEPLLCAGRVVDARSAPVPDADVVAGSLPWVHGSVSRNGSFSRRSSSVARGKTVRGRSDAGGRFELRGLWIEESFPVRASSGNAISPEVTARQGDVGLVLALTPRFKLSGELVVDPGIDPNAIRFALERPGAERAAVAQGVTFVDQPERFELEPIEGGSVDLLFLLEDTELTRLAGLAVGSDLDLGPIDLRGRVAVCEIELVGEGDLSALDGQFDWGPSGGDESHHGSFRGALVHITAPQVPIDVALRPRGHRQARLERVSGQRQCVLEEPLRVRLVLHTSGTLPAPPYRLGADLYQGDMAVSEPVETRWFTPEQSEIECLVSTPGRFVARWQLVKKIDADGMRGWSGVSGLEEYGVTLDVRDEPGVQVIPLELDGAVLDGVIRGLH